MSTATLDKPTDAPPTRSHRTRNRITAIAATAAAVVGFAVAAASPAFATTATVTASDHARSGQKFLFTAHDFAANGTLTVTDTTTSTTLGSSIPLGSDGSTGPNTYVTLPSPITADQSLSFSDGTNSASLTVHITTGATVTTGAYTQPGGEISFIASGFHASGHLNVYLDSATTPLNATTYPLDGTGSTGTTAVGVQIPIGTSIGIHTLKFKDTALSPTEVDLTNVDIENSTTASADLGGVYTYVHGTSPSFTGSGWGSGTLVTIKITGGPDNVRDQLSTTNASSVSPVGAISGSFALIPPTGSLAGSTYPAGSYIVHFLATGLAVHIGITIT